MCLESICYVARSVTGNEVEVLFLSQLPVNTIFGFYFSTCELVQQTEVQGTSANLQGIVEQLAHFRSEVRSLALSHRKDTATASLRNPLLKACDTLRNDLAPLGILIKVSSFLNYYTKQKSKVTLSV